MSLVQHYLPKLITVAGDRSDHVDRLLRQFRSPHPEINSGDVVETQTRMLYNDKLKPGATMDEIVKWRAAMGVNKTGHTLTGPIYINDAEPGDVLQVDIMKLTPRPYAANYNMPPFQCWRTAGRFSRRTVEVSHHRFEEDDREIQR